MQTLWHEDYATHFVLHNKDKKNPKSTQRQMNHPPKPRGIKNRKIVVVCIIAMIIYAVLLVFADFGVIPFSGIIRKPISLIMGILVYIIESISLLFSKMHA